VSPREARAYSDAVGWLKAARTRRVRRMHFAERALGATVAAALPLLCAFALLSPGSFGAPASSTFGSGWPLYALLGLLGLSVLLLLTNWKRIRWFAARAREPFVRPPSGDQAYEGGADALAACTGAQQTRFAFWWIWAPAGLGLLGVITGMSATYFLVDGILARLDVGWGHLILAGVNLVLSYVFFALAARRLTTWRWAVAIHKSVTTGY
jgi:hypothetical protein